MRDFQRQFTWLTLCEPELAEGRGRTWGLELPELIELVMVRPLISAGMVTKMSTSRRQAARRIVVNSVFARGREARVRGILNIVDKL